ncbi:hypothetical protein ACFL1B_02905 [Nanoarchaeota archaeon]
MKKQLTRQEEFEIMKVVLDKLLLLGILIMAYGFWRTIELSVSFWYGLIIMLSGGLILLLFMMLLVKEYNYMK